MILALCAGCTGATQGGVINNPFVKNEPAPVFTYDGHVRQFSFWQDHSPETKDWTTAITINVDCDDPFAVTHAQQILASDSRPVIWFAPMFAYGAEGYELRENAAWCWQREADLIRANRSRSLMVWLLDEPPDVAWSFWVDGGTRYDPNRYNAILTQAAGLVASVFPDVPTAYNFGSLPQGATVAEGVALVGLETYAADWQAKLQTLETLTSNPIWLLAPAFVQGDPSKDSEIAQRVRDEWAWAQHDQRVTGFYPFLWCCDDLQTGTKDFYTVSGGHLPLLLHALRDVAQSLRP